MLLRFNRCGGGEVFVDPAAVVSIEPVEFREHARTSRITTSRGVVTVEGWPSEVAARVNEARADVCTGGEAR